MALPTCSPREGGGQPLQEPTHRSCLESNCGSLDSDFLRERACLITGSVEYRGAEKSLARPGRKQANVSVRMA